MEKGYEGQERRKDTRLYQSIPIEYRFINVARPKDSSERRPAHINITNISSNGVLLELNELNEDWIEDLKSGRLKIALEIKIPAPFQLLYPGIPESIRVIAKVAWLEKKEEPDGTKKYLLGLSFTDITDEEQNKIIRHIINYHFKI